MPSPVKDNGKASPADPVVQPDNPPEPVIVAQQGPVLDYPELIGARLQIPNEPVIPPGVTRYGTGTQHPLEMEADPEFRAHLANQLAAGVNLARDELGHNITYGIRVQRSVDPASNTAYVFLCYYA